MHNGAFILVISMTSMVMMSCFAFAGDDVHNQSKTGYAELDAEFTASIPTKQESAVVQSAKGDVDSDQSINRVKPTILVVPAKSGKGTDAFTVAMNNPYTKACLAEVNSYLVAKNYELKSFEGQEALNNLIQVQHDVAGKDDDMAYLASLSVGADAYITCDGDAFAPNQSLTVRLSAYETTTARLLSEVTLSKEVSPMNQGVLAAGFKELSKRLMPDLEHKMISHWYEDIKSGVRYRIIFSIVGEFTEDELEDLHDDLKEKMKALFKQVKFNNVSNKTIDVIVFADPSLYDDSQDVASKIRKSMKNVANISKKSITAKLILMDIK